MAFTLFLITYLIIFATLITLAYRDLKDYILPDILNLNLFIMLIILNYLSKFELAEPTNMLIGSLSGGGLMLAIKFVADKFYQEDSLGLGDVKLIFAAGIGLGFPNIFMVLSLGAFFGVVHGFFMSYKLKKPLAEIQVPAGVGFTLAIFIMLHAQILTWLNF